MKTAMKTMLCLVLALVGLPLSPALVRASAAQGDELAAVPRISQAEFKQALSSNSILVVDVRDAQLYADGHIPGAVSVPLDALKDHVKELQAAGKPIVTYCA